MELQDLIEHHNGHFVWNFSHQEFVFLSGQEKGLCAALCANWIRYHSQNSSLANYFSIGPDKKKYMKKQLARHMARLNDFFNLSGTHERLTLFFQMHGLIPLYSSHERTILSFPEEEVLERVACRKKMQICCKGHDPEIEIEIADSLYELNNCYAVVVFWSPQRNAAHTICAWLGRLYEKPEDACLFDPSYGEMWFSRRQDFIRFFPEFFSQFYKSKGYRGGWFLIPFATASPW